MIECTVHMCGNTSCHCFQGLCICFANFCNHFLLIQTTLFYLKRHYFLKCIFVYENKFDTKKSPSLFFSLITDNTVNRINDLRNRIVMKFIKFLLDNPSIIGDGLSEH